MDEFLCLLECDYYYSHCNVVTGSSDASSFVDPTHFDELERLDLKLSAFFFWWLTGGLMNLVGYMFASVLYMIKIM